MALLGIGASQNPQLIGTIMQHQASQAEHADKKRELEAQKLKFQTAFNPILATSKLPKNIIEGIKGASIEDQEKLFQAAIKLQQDKSVLESAESLIQTLPEEQRPLARAAAKVGNTAFISSLIATQATKEERTRAREEKGKEKVARQLSQEQLILAGQKAKLKQEQFEHFEALIKLGATTQAEKFLEKNAPGVIKAFLREQPTRSSQAAPPTGEVVMVRHKPSGQTKQYPIGQIPQLTSDFEIVQ